jgi:hypothetical protein
MHKNKTIVLFTLPFFLFFTQIGQSAPPQGSISDFTTPNPIKKIVKAIAKANVFVLAPPAQPLPLVTEQEKNYLLLSRLATSNELEDLIMNHKNAVVRMYAFKALTTQMHHISENIMQVINNDTTLIDCINREKIEKTQIKILAQNFLN